MNDITILAGCIAFFLIGGFIMPYVQAEFNNANYDYDLENEMLGVQSEITDEGSVSLFDVAVSIFKMSVWSFGTFPVWVDVLLWIVRGTFWVTLGRNIWVGGGG